MPTRHEIPIEDETIVAIHHEADTDGWLVFCHGFQSDKSGSYESRCERAVEEGYNGVRFDFRGCGESSRSFGEQTLSTRTADLEAVLDYFEPPSYVLFGSSFGGKVAFHSDHSDRLKAIATRAPVTYNRAFDKYREAFTESAGDFAETATAFFDDFDAYSFETVRETIDVPVAIFHGRDDDSVPIEDSIEAVGALETDVLLQAYAGEGHLFSREAEAQMREQLFTWLRSTADYQPTK